MSFPESNNIYKVLQSIKKLNNFQSLFLLSWYESVGNGTFGFKDCSKLEEQAKKAIGFYLKTQKEWQEGILNNILPDIKFIDYLISKIYDEGCDLPDDFSPKLIKKMEEL